MGELSALFRGGAAQEHIKSLETELTEMYKSVPNYLQKFVEELQDGRGIRLRELSVLAATLEDLIHKESSQRLEMTYKALELPFTATLDEEQLKEALEIYMMIYMLGGNFTLTGQKAGNDIQSF